MAPKGARSHFAHSACKARADPLRFTPAWNTCTHSVLAIHGALYRSSQAFKQIGFPGPHSWASQQASDECGSAGYPTWEARTPGVMGCPLLRHSIAEGSWHWK
jgi:hypothetical protein